MGRQADWDEDEERDPPQQLSARELALWVRSEAVRGIVWAQPRKKRFRSAASITRMVTLGLSGASTVILGLQDLDFWASLGFSLVALSTVVAAVEPFFNWRSRWVLMEEAQAELRRIRDELDYLLATRGDDELRREDIEPFFERSQQVWRQTSTRWLDQRRRGEVVQ
ncbi:hypothetical protein FHX44_111474 [Pseudonocardia hierapolitana]|uniref:SMODS and SLOG-associating 2TM effector domain-containing protein n=1 Tax=Pseudonocardia hierapolitana TaxID=1128676 RepID=A0A561SL66_9PSEU|nr:SLATT domain-containing protein [Pseudonocardia hierapolitana]TWF75590.1 hypothetical protein FHX44_111474 [Pseudonocardia hierapolitana]